MPIKAKSYKDILIVKIPEEWKVVRLGDKNLAEIIMGQSPPSATYNKNGKGVPFLQGKAEFGETYPSPIVFCSEPIKIAEANDVLISVRAPVGDVNIAPLRCCVGRGLASIRANNQKLHSFYLFYFLKSQKRKLESLSSGSTFKAVKKEDIENFNIPVPPLPEQKKIAEILSTVDKAIEKVDEAIEKTQRLKKGLMQELLTGRWNTVDGRQGRRKFKQTEIGRIPKEWEAVSLEDIVTKFISGGTPSTKEPSYWNGEIPWITSAYINGFYVSSGEKYISKAGLENSATNIVPKDNILIATRVGIGKVAVNLIDIAISQDLTGALVRKEKVYPNFLCWSFLSSKVLNVLKSFVRGTTIKGIARSELVKIHLPLPPLHEQKKIAEILSTVDKRLELLRKKREKLERVKKGLMNDLLSGKKSVINLISKEAM